MEYLNFKSNTVAGDNFIKNIADTEIRWKLSIELFTQFIEINGFSAWHIHDGWVTHNYRSGDVLHNKDIKITWVTEHAGYSHTFTCPEVGEKMIIIKRSPDIEKLKPFDIYCYEVTERSKPFIYHDVKLKLIEVKQAVFNKQYNCYQLHIKNRKRLFGLILAAISANKEKFNDVK